MKNLACHYDVDQDTWFVQVPFSLPQPTLERVKDYIFKVNHDRMIACMPGDKKDYLKKALDALAQGRLQQMLTNKGEQVLFGSTERENPNKIYTFGGKA